MSTLTDRQAEAQRGQPSYLRSYSPGQLAVFEPAVYKVATHPTSPKPSLTTALPLQGHL